MVLHLGRRFASRLINATKAASKLCEVEYPSDIKLRTRRWVLSQEAERALYKAPRPDFIKVVCVHPQGLEFSMQMTRGISTPYDCAKHLCQLICARSVIAHVNGKPYDMHRALREDSTVTFVEFKDRRSDPTAANLAFWRSCQLVMAAAVESAFEEKYNMRLFAFPQTPIESGSFVADFRLQCETTEEFERMISWSPSEVDLRAISQVGQAICANSSPFECLDFGKDVALSVMQDNYRMLAFDNVSSDENCTLYRVGNYVQVSLFSLNSSHIYWSLV